MRVCVCGQERGRVCVCARIRARKSEREGVAEFLGGWTHQPTFFRWNGSKMSSILTPALHNPNPLKNQFQSLLNNCEQHRFIFLLDCDPLLTTLFFFVFFLKRNQKLNWSGFDLIPRRKISGLWKFYGKIRFRRGKKFFGKSSFFRKNAETAESDKKWSNKLVSNKLEKSRCFVFLVLLF